MTTATPSGDPPNAAAAPASAPAYDTAVIGAGFGGLATALELARQGARVIVLETLGYPGGCAGTFLRGGHRFEAGATLFSGLAPHQLFGRWIRELDLPVTIDWIDPLIEMRTPDFTLTLTREREGLVESLARLPGAPSERVRSFFAEQRRVADALWELFDRPELLPPLTARSLWQHTRRAHRVLPLLGLAATPLARVLKRHGVQDFAPLRLYLDALCQITVQCGVAEAEAPFALSAADYCYRGTGHIRGGIGELASALAQAIRTHGGEVRFLHRVNALQQRGNAWQVTTKRGVFAARTVAANLLPQDLERLLGQSTRNLERLARRVATGWGAAMLYLVAREPAGTPTAARHFQLIQDPAHSLIEGNHLFVSISGAQDCGRAAAGHRTLTVSTHVDLATLRSLDEPGRAAHLALIQERLRAGLRRFLPEWASGITSEMTASPRTFRRFTGRHEGLVGGIPRRAGWWNYRDLGPQRVLPGLYLVGDSVFPGQSTLATATGGVRLATRIAAELRRSAPG